MFASWSIRERLRGWLKGRLAGGGAILDHPVLGPRIFFPRTSGEEADLVVRCRGAQLSCFRRIEHPNAKIILHFHGNGEIAADYLADFAGLFLGMGVNACFAEYRGYGASTGSPALVAMLDDGERILKALGIPQEQVIVYGRSLGSLYAVELARRCPRIAGLILEGGIADLLERLRLRVQPFELGCSDTELAAEVNRHFNQRDKLGRYRGPLLVLHARDDRTIDQTHAVRCHSWGGGAEKKLVIFPRGGHNALIWANLEAYRREVSSFLRCSLGAPN